jgi:hypothetical protein
MYKWTVEYAYSKFVFKPKLKKAFVSHREIFLLYKKNFLTKYNLEAFLARLSIEEHGTTFTKPLKRLQEIS